MINSSSFCRHLCRKFSHKWIKWQDDIARKEGQQEDQTLHRVAIKEREEIKRTTKQKMAKRHSKEGGNHLEQESNRQRTMEGIGGGLQPAVDGQSLGKR